MAAMSHSGGCCSPLRSLTAECFHITERYGQCYINVIPMINTSVKTEIKTFKKLRVRPLWKNSKWHDNVTP